MSIELDARILRRLGPMLCDLSELSEAPEVSELPNGKIGRSELDQNFQDECEQYAKLPCQALCKEIHNKFPREVRDQIYELLIGDSAASMEKVMDCRLFPPVDILDREQWPPNLYHCWMRSFLGKAVYQELVESWYRVTLFRIDKPSLIESLISQDVFNAIDRPGDFISNISFMIEGDMDFHINHYHFKQPWSDLLKPKASPKPLVPFEKLICALKKLSMFRPGTRIDFYFYTETPRKQRRSLHHCTADYVEQFIMLLTRNTYGNYSVVECLRDLRKAGYQLKITLDDQLELSIDTGFDINIWLGEVSRYSLESRDEK